ncbi:unnamed protein product [Mytilus coruscus]|uniref:QRICH1-like domain-containing protein n=1 Tax=Mytilus coruscus TaxID=42192 RepID=A0A6J8EHP6_MYTCO|nr:unnamed protein product [Mytilus coruscus]
MVLKIYLTPLERYLPPLERYLPPLEDFCNLDNVDECNILVPRKRSRNRLYSPKASGINIDHCEKDHILNKFFDSSDVFEHRSYDKCYRGKSNSLPALFHSHAWKSTLDKKSFPFQFDKFEERCSESSVCINKGTSDDSTSEMEDVILDFESIRSSDVDTSMFADSTMSKIKWATTLFKQWKSTRNIRANDPNVGLSPIRVDLAEMSLDELNYSISRFICEVRKTDGTEYPPDTLYSLVICLQL